MMGVVLVTGAGRGLGRALFDVYLGRGWRVIPLVRRAEIAAELHEVGGDYCHPVVADVSEPGVEDTISQVFHEIGQPLDLLINNAGNIKKLYGIECTTPEDMEKLFRVHCVGVLRCVRATLPFLTMGRRPMIINVSSRRGSIARMVVTGRKPLYSYQVAKAAQNMLTACLDEDLKSRGIRAYSIHPGRLHTDAAPPDADTHPLDAAETIAAWIEGLSGDEPCHFYDMESGHIVPW